MKLYETASLTALSLSETQKELLCKIVAAPEIPEKDGKKIDMENDHHVSARNMLEQLGLITIADQTEFIQLTDKGNEVMQEENLVDGSGQLTSVGQEYSTRSTDVSNPPAPPGNPQASGDMAGVPSTGEMGAGGSPTPNGPALTMGFAAYLKANSTIL